MWRNWLAVLLLCAPAAAQIDSPSRVGVGVIKRKLSLADAIEMALKKNLEIEIEKTNISVAAQSVHGAHGYLDPRFRWAPRYESRQIPTSSPLVGANGKLVEKVGSQTFSWSQRLPWWGMGIQAQFENDRQSTTNPFTSLSPYQTGRLGASLTLPLLRNRKTDPARANLRITNKQKELSETQFRLKVIDVVSRVEEAYWNLVAARQSVRVASEAVKLAREQLARTRRMIESGTLAPVELAAAEAELERRVDTWYSSIGLVTEVENALKLLITENRQEPLWDDEIIPTEERTLEPPRVDDVRAAVRSALQKRPELRQIGLRLETNDIQARLARNQTRPEVNVVAGYTVAGLAGTLSSTENPFSKLPQLRRRGEHANRWLWERAERHRPRHLSDRVRRPADGLRRPQPRRRSRGGQGSHRRAPPETAARPLRPRCATRCSRSRPPASASRPPKPASARPSQRPRGRGTVAERNPPVPLRRID